MADDEFDIDIYGDDNAEEVGSVKKDTEGDAKTELNNGNTVDHARHDNEKSASAEDDDYVDVQLKSEEIEDALPDGQQQIKTTDEPAHAVLSIPRQAPQQQGVKRKQAPDDRPVEPGATTALLISDLHWWITDDDIRGWVNQAGVEDELSQLTFSEHKVNGKSKGQAYLEFASQQAATAAKHKIDTFGEGQQYAKKHTVTFSNPNLNPFRTLPKDAPVRPGKDGPGQRGGSFGYGGDRGSGGGFGGGFRGRGMGYNGVRGGGLNGNMNQNNFNRNFSTPAMGNMANGFNPQMAGFQGNAMASQFGGFNRGGMINAMRGAMRGGRGGMNNAMMGAMAGMGNMPMGAMGAMGNMGGMPMNMGAMAGGMPGSGGFQGQMHFNPAFFQQNQNSTSDWQNPHGAKRPRPE